MFPSPYCRLKDCCAWVQYLAMSIEPDVPLEIETEWDSEMPTSAGKFKIVGPELQRNILRNKLQLSKEQLRKHSLPMPLAFGV